MITFSHCRGHVLELSCIKPYIPYFNQQIMCQYYLLGFSDAYLTLYVHS
jgi:hypothetical protein